MSDLFGWELLCLASAGTINSKENAMVGFLHWTLTKSGFRCIGVGPKCDGAAYGSEALPSGWSLTDGDYTLMYTVKGELYVLRSLRTDECLVVNLMRSCDKEVSCVLFNVEECVATISGTLEEMVPTYETMVEKIRSQLIAPVIGNKARSVTTQTEEIQKTIPDRQTHVCGYIRDGLDWDPITSRPLGNIGRNDLDPLGGFGHGGGMVFNPFGEGRRANRDPGLGIPGPGLGIPGPGLGIPGGILPRGAVPPGARFDPFGPLGGRPMPNPDHLPPPGYDDMFM